MPGGADLNKIIKILYIKRETECVKAKLLSSYWFEIGIICCLSRLFTFVSLRNHDVIPSIPSLQMALTED